MSRILTAAQFTRGFNALLVFALVIAALPHCAMACCETMPARGMLPTTAAHCSGACEDRDQTISTAAQNTTSDATVTSPHISTLVAATALIEPSSGLSFPQDAQSSAPPTSLAIYLRDRSFLV